MAAIGRGYRGGRYKGRSAGSRVVLYGLILAVALWLVGPFVWLFVTSVSYQKNLLARPFALIPPEVTMDNDKMILGLIRFHAAGQAAKILPSMLNSVVVAVVVTILNLVIGTTAGYAYARYRFPLKTLSLFALLFTRMLPTVLLVHAALHRVDHEGVLRDGARRARQERARRRVQSAAGLLPRGAARVGAGARGGRRVHLHAVLERVHRRPGAEHQAGHDDAAPGDRGHERPDQHRLLGDRRLRLPRRAARRAAGPDLPEIHGTGAHRRLRQGLSGPCYRGARGGGHGQDADRQRDDSR